MRYKVTLYFPSSVEDIPGTTVTRYVDAETEEEALKELKLTESELHYIVHIEVVEEPIL